MQKSLSWLSLLLVFTLVLAGCTQPVPIAPGEAPAATAEAGQESTEGGEAAAPAAAQPGGVWTRAGIADAELLNPILSSENASSAVNAMNAALPDVDLGVSLAASAAEALQAIESGARQTLERVREIADPTREQSTASTSIAQRVEEISNMVESTSESIRGAADAAVGLERIAVSLKDQIARFRV